MLWHAIPPSRAYVKAPHDVVRHSKLSSDAKILIVYVQGLPESRAGEALSDHAKKLGIKGRAYQKAKGQLRDAGFVHEWRRQVGGGLWVTDQLFSNAPLTDEEARRLRDTKAQAEPGDRYPADGRATTRSVGASPPEAEEREKNSPHPPSEPHAIETPAAEMPTAEAPEPVTAPAPEVREAEGVLLSLRHASPQLHLGVTEARGLSEMAADWLRRGVKAAELRAALVSGLPADGVRSAFGFVRHRLVQKLPEPPAYVPEVRPYVACAGDGPEHVFRPRADETLCRPCAQRAAEEAHFVKWPPRAPAPDSATPDGAPERVPWRERVAAVLGEDAARPASAAAG
ncbi:hypothetical protein K388_01206 [Streptomyces sp. KhCrAH-43]|uniref:hypothetical protein n=1 Tax=unclassified Streptomyces TaxID=2593676 RepID=UPI0003632832|nr:MULTISPECIES: hypothetical protein [unclassified Streptomyces]MYS38769.1 hypothetical protein [Streptomyces sp. SID4920]MYX66961.1 hypothetical protein [Streptomyces sp. SID8373]RAJ68458.1 hypothetical protein K388_01206 [Streptomyces sp. KhCrAH-43]